MDSLGRDIAARLREQTADDKSATELFCEEPPPLAVFVEDRKYLANPPLSPVQYDFVRHFEQILFPETYPAMVEEFGPYWTPVRYVNFLNAQWAKGSGKDHVCRIASLRIANILLCLRDPLIYFSLPAQDSIHLLNVAASASQANRAFFKPMKRAVEREGGWFSDKAEAGVGTIEYDKHIEAISGHSDAETQEGLNILVGVADEIDAFPSKDEVLAKRARGVREPSNSAEAILDMMRSSSRTRFPRTFKNARISYPRFKGSTIQQLTARGRADNLQNGENSRIYVTGPLATWEVNPRVSGPEDFREDYDEDPDMARAKYECKPEPSSNRFFRNDVALTAAFSDERKTEPLEVEYAWGLPDGEHAAVGLEMSEGWQAKFTLSPDLRPMAGARYAMHGDMAISGDTAGIAMAHVHKWEQTDHYGEDFEGGHINSREIRPAVKLDFVIGLTADIAAQPVPREIQIRWSRELCWLLSSIGFNIVRFTYDGFASKDSMQIIAQRGIETARVSTDLSNDVWNALRDVMYDGRLKGYKNERLITEFQGLTRKSNGKVDHPPYGSKDLADAVGGAVHGALLAGGTEDGDGLEATPSGDEILTMGGAAMPRGFTLDLPTGFETGRLR
jgi:hypothetical protein